jgi:hypothetical protein
VFRSPRRSLSAKSNRTREGLNRTREGLTVFLRSGAGGVWSKITLEKEAHFDKRRCARANTFRSTGGVVLCSSSAGIMLSARARC